MKVCEVAGLALATLFRLLVILIKTVKWKYFQTHFTS